MSNENIHIHHFSIVAPADVIDKVVEFYVDVVGLKVGFRPEFNVPGYWLYAGDEAIIHLAVSNNRSKGTPGYFHHIALRCQDINEMTNRLEKFQVNYKRSDLDSVGIAQLIVTDPAGTPVELNFRKTVTA